MANEVTQVEKQQKHLDDFNKLTNEICADYSVSSAILIVVDKEGGSSAIQVGKDFELIGVMEQMKAVMVEKHLRHTKGITK